MWQRFWTLPHLSMRYHAWSWAGRESLSADAFDLSRNYEGDTDSKPLLPMGSFSIACIHRNVIDAGHASHSRGSISRLPDRVTARLAVDRRQGEGDSLQKLRLQDSKLLPVGWIFARAARSQHPHFQKFPFPNKIYSLLGLGNFHLLM